MNDELVNYLISYLLNEMPQYKKYASKYSSSMSDRKKLLRSLMNLRPPMEASEQFLKLQNYYLQNELENMGLVDCNSLTVSDYSKIALWKGDIMRLKVDAIVNPGNEDMLGCFVPNHNCIDNEIHSYAGVQLRSACQKETKLKGSKMAIGDVFVTGAYNLPSSFVFHVLGPSIRGRTTYAEQNLLKRCYVNVLKKATSMNLKTIVFPCISAGEQGFPKKEAAFIATETVKDFILSEPKSPAVIFDVFTDVDEKYYTELLFE